MARRHHIRARLPRFAKDENGAALVEFGILLPTLLVILAVMVEGGRMVWSYQMAIAGVRDATRYLVHAAPADICETGGTLSSLEPTLITIVSQGIDGSDVFASTVTVTDVTTSLACVSGGFRIDPAALATVTADLTITYPFGGVFTFLGLSLDGVTTEISDQARIVGA